MTGPIKVVLLSSKLDNLLTGIFHSIVIKFASSLSRSPASLILFTNITFPFKCLYHTWAWALLLNIAEPSEQILNPTLTEDPMQYDEN